MTLPTGRVPRAIALLLSVALFFALLSTGMNGAQASATDIVLYASDASSRVGSWELRSDSTAADGVRLHSIDAGSSKLAAPLASPPNYFEMSFNAEAGTAYRLWVRSKADGNSPYNDSIYVQFSGSTNASGGAVFRIGTTSATVINLEDCLGCGVAGWGWQDNGWGTGILGPLIYFQTTGQQTLRVHAREDGISVDQIVLSPATFITGSPGSLKNDTTIISQGTPPPAPPPSGGAGAVIWAADISGSRIHGNWSKVFNASAAGQTALLNPDAGAGKLSNPLASPATYFEATFDAQAGTPYRLWVRGQAANDSPYNDSFFVQFSGSADAGGAAVYRIGTTSATTVNLEDCSGCTLSGWGWQDNGWGSNVRGPLIYFQGTGAQTIRIQPREDGVSIDQIVLSPQAYLTESPGALRNDTVILASTIGSPTSNQPPSATVSASPTSGVFPLNVSFSTNASDPDGFIASYNWTFGDGQTSSQASPSIVYQSAGTFTAQLTVTDNEGATASTSRTITVNSPSVPTGSTIKVIDWNIQMGKGTDNVYNLDRTATYIANMGPHIVTLCEVQRYPNDDQAQKLSDLLRQKTGVSWFYYFVPKYSGTTEGNLILSRFPLSGTASLFLTNQRSVARATISVNGRSITIFATHLDPDSSSVRAAQISALRNWASGTAGDNLVTGDFNAWPGASEIGGMTSWCSDGWANAANWGLATAYPDNPVHPVDTRTRRARIDYVFYRGANLVLRSAQVPDIRDLSRTPVILLGTPDDRGVRPSDHNMTVMTFEVR
jgi:endonuclease/exonuclease/phosphatase family metal-dependent hydrolase